MAKATLLMHQFVTHDTRRFIISRPERMKWKPGQGVELAIDTRRWRDEGHPFTPTSLTRDRVLEFVIKCYPSEGLTQALHALEPGADLILSDPFGTITYQGPGVFIAAGTGITPFLGMLRDLELRGKLEGHALLYTTKSERDLICGDELRHLLGDQATFTFTREHDSSQDGHRIDAAFLSNHIEQMDQHFYLCGPEAFVESVSNALITLGVHPDRLVVER